MKFKFFLLFVFVVSVCFAEELSCPNLAINELFAGDNGTYLGVAFMLMILLVAVAYMGGSLTQDTHLTVFAKDEFFQVLISGVIVAGIAGLLLFSCTFFSSMFSLGTSNPQFQAAIADSVCYNQQTLSGIALCSVSSMEDKVRSMAGTAIKQSIKQEMDSTFAMGIYNPLTGGAVVPRGAYKRTYAMQYDMVANSFLIPVLVSLTMQRIFISFSTDLVLFLIPAGLFLRILAPTRQMGHVVIALVIGLVTVLPLFYAFNGLMFDAIDIPTCQFNDAVFGECDDVLGFATIARFMPQAFFLPNLTIALFITFLSAINKALRVIT